MTGSNRPAFPVRRLWPSLMVAAVLIGGCGAGSSASSAGALPTAVAPTAAPTLAGPTDFAAWIERQGFGGSSGLNNVNKLAGWLVNHATEVRVFDLDQDGGDVAKLLAWLDTHPATDCWADYHAAVRASLEAIAAGYATTRVAVEAGKPAPAEVIGPMYQEATKALGLPRPANCA
jgi:hypothetical protein